MKCFKCFQYSLSCNYLQETCSLTILCWQPPGSGWASSPSNKKMNRWPLSHRPPTSMGRGVAKAGPSFGKWLARSDSLPHLQSQGTLTSPTCQGHSLYLCLPRSVLQKHNTSWSLVSIFYLLLSSLCLQLEMSWTINSWKSIHDSDPLTLCLAVKGNIIYDREPKSIQIHRAYLA